MIIIVVHECTLLRAEYHGVLMFFLLQERRPADARARGHPQGAHPRHPRPARPALPRRTRLPPRRTTRDHAHMKSDDEKNPFGL